MKPAGSSDSAKKHQTSWAKNRKTRGSSIPITPQMIREAVEKLQTRRVFVSSDLIASQLGRQFPVASDSDTLRDELEEQLRCAIYAGLISKCGNNMYCIPSLRQEANMDKTALTTFWDQYYGNALSRMRHRNYTEVSYRRENRRAE